ncbi:MAG: hypothetical protein ACK4UX_02680 [Thiobacillus sp.]
MLHDMANTIRTPEKERAFLAALAETCSVSRACESAGIGRATVYEWRAADPDFAASWEKAKRIGAEALEDECVRRAREGVDEPVFYQGDECGSVRKYSDTLAIFLLKGAMPEKYRENTRMELTGANGGPVQISDTERAAKIAAILAAAKARKDGDVSDLV